MIGILLVNLGTPEAPTAPALRRYLREFLSDPRVVEIPRIVWWPILNGPILLTRPARSARAYRSIWLDEGSPLRVYSERLAAGLQALYDGEQPGRVLVRLAMRYGQPSVAAGLRALRDAGCQEILVVPLYPQYSATTTASIFDAVAAELRSWRNLPELHFLRDWHQDPRYIGALARSVQQQWQERGRAERLLISFHGLPARNVALGDPYRGECEKTTALLVAALGLQEGEWVQTFQSRFGPARWLEPYTAVTLEELGRQGVDSIDCLCPGFVTDCLETLEEVAIGGKEIFLHAGGKQLHYLPCLNDDPAWIADFRQIIDEHLPAR
ncbi:ferrochelatase [Acidithiobacillus sp. AMEEHan]|uniref:ferrochelatase n=1 Tax=Acidithiobacillus sp. AMEEHan TaxID=2994951 RepID=UPI0027E4C4EA|nr:ferrochelatase [Acidithiobacillus sp. AMEEHan]